MCHKRISWAFIEVHPLADNPLTEIKRVLHPKQLWKNKFSIIKNEASLVRIQIIRLSYQTNFCRCSILNMNCANKHNVYDMVSLGSTQEATQAVYLISSTRCIRAFISHLKNLCHKRISSAFIEVHPLKDNLSTGIQPVLHSNKLLQNRFSKITI